MVAALSRTITYKGDWQYYYQEVRLMKWDTPSYNDIRFGFEVTMYINNK